ncbi:MAG: threonine/serine exporter family protein, partial [Clostridiales Family XIII bacterium]|nr:threonine/serine exporter family protein [Clostridiales Family XIII bacterium]
SRAGKDATTIFIIPCIIPLVPGTQMFYTMYYIIKYNFEESLGYGIEALFCAGAIAIALVFTATITRIFMMFLRKIISKVKGQK